MSRAAINKRAREIYEERQKHNRAGTNLDDWRRAELEIENERNGMVIATIVHKTKIGGLVTPELANRPSVRVSAIIIRVAEKI